MTGGGGGGGEEERLLITLSSVEFPVNWKSFLSGRGKIFIYRYHRKIVPILISFKRKPHSDFAFTNAFRVIDTQLCRLFWHRMSKLRKRLHAKKHVIASFPVYCVFFT